MALRSSSPCPVSDLPGPVTDTHHGVSSRVRGASMHLLVFVSTNYAEPHAGEY